MLEDALDNLAEEIIQNGGVDMALEIDGDTIHEILDMLADGNFSGLRIYQERLANRRWIAARKQAMEGN